MAFCEGSCSEDEILEKYFPIVEKALFRFEHKMNGFVDKEQIRSAGNLGLLKAVRNYDSSKCPNFEIYASTVVRQSMCDEIRTEYAKHGFDRRGMKKVHFLPLENLDFEDTSEPSGFCHEDLFHISRYGLVEFVEKEEEYILLRDAVDSLPEKYRNPIRDYFFGEMTLEEIAMNLKITPQGVLFRLNKAKKNLEKILYKIGIMSAL